MLIWHLTSQLVGNLAPSDALIENIGSWKFPVHSMAVQEMGREVP